jgi:hypothetical protein
MKKIFMSIMAFAAIAMTMTSCNKEEIASTDITVAYEESEVMDQVKMHFEGDNQYWDEGDLIYMIDASNNVAYYTIDPANPSQPVFQRNVVGNFNVNNGILTAAYPASIVYKKNEVRIPARQYSIDGAISTSYPIFAQATYGDFVFRNLCAVYRLNVTGNVAIDSVSVTTDKCINGIFTVNLNNLNTPLTYLSQGFTGYAHGTNTNTVRFNHAIQTSSTPQTINIYLPAGTYNHVKFTFYSGNNTYVKYSNSTQTLNRRNYNSRNFTLGDFELYERGTLNGNAMFNVAGDGEPAQYVIFSQGNLEFIFAQSQYWNFAGNQWDFRGNNQCRDFGNSWDRDLFAWGANGYVVRGTRSGYVGNSTLLWPVNREYAYCNATELLTVDEWGNNKIANGGNQLNSGWRTLTATEMQNILDNHAHAMVTLSLTNKQGLIIFPDGVTPLTDGATIANKTDWNTLEAAGCVFFVADSYRAATGSNMPARMTNTGSYFWLNTTADANTASALIVDKVAGASIDNNVNKRIGGYVRLVKDVQ